MVTGVLFLMLVLLALVLAAFICQIVITPVAAVDAPTLLKSAAAPDAPAPALPGGQHRISAATRPTPGTSPPGASDSQHRWATAALAMAGVAASTIGGWLFLHIAPGGAALLTSRDRDLFPGVRAAHWHPTGRRHHRRGRQRRSRHRARPRHPLAAQTTHAAGAALRS